MCAGEDSYLFVCLFLLLNCRVRVYEEGRRPFFAPSLRGKAFSISPLHAIPRDIWVDPRIKTLR